MTLQSVLGCKVCSALEKQSVPRSKVFFDAKCASAGLEDLETLFVRASHKGRVAGNVVPWQSSYCHPASVPYLGETLVDTNMLFISKFLNTVDVKVIHEGLFRVNVV